MTPHGRHLAREDVAREAHPAVVLAAALLVGCVAVGIVGLVSLHHLRALDAPFRPAAASAAPWLPGEPAPGHEDDPAWRAAAVSPLLSMRPAAVRCAAPDLDVRRADAHALEQRLQAIAACFDAAWEPAVTGAGLAFEPVTVRVFEPSDGTGSTCGETEAVVPALYCPQDSTIYVSGAAVSHAHGDTSQAEASLTGTLAHEYGHHVQSLTGVLDAADALPAGPGHGGDGDRAEPLRRVETMATCLGALTHTRLASPLGPTQAFYERMTDPGSYRADASHGRAGTQARWAARGYEADGDASACAAFSAPAAAVA